MFKNTGLVSDDVSMIDTSMTGPPTKVVWLSAPAIGNDFLHVSPRNE